VANIDLKELELVYRNAETQEELDLALQFHGMSSSELYRLASDRGWETSPIAAKNLAAQVDALPNAAPADEKFIEESNKAAIRRLHSMLECSLTRFHSEYREMSIGAIVDCLDKFSKVRERLTKLELPLYGLSTMEPVVVANPINVFIDTTPEPEEVSG